MENNILVKNLEKRYTYLFNALEGIIKICPDELWNEKCSGYTFSHQLVHALCIIYLWLRDEEINFFDAIDVGINGLSIYNELDSDSKDVVGKLHTKNDVSKICNGAKSQCEKWFKDKNDNWLFLPIKMDLKRSDVEFTNFDVTMEMIQHTMYHIGHCEAIFREKNINPGKYLGN